MKRSHAIPFFLLWSLALDAQDFGYSDEPFAWGYSILMNGQYSSIGELNEILVDSKLNEIDSRFLSLGVGLNMKYSNHVLQFSGNVALSDPENETDGIQNSSFGYGVTISYGYHIQLGNFSLIPYIGGTRNFLILQIEDFVDDNVRFNNRLLLRNSTKLENENFGIQLGLRFLIPLDWETAFVGFNAGYTVPTISKWNVGNFKAKDGPKTNLGGLKMGIELVFMIGNWYD